MKEQKKMKTDNNTTPPINPLTGGYFKATNQRDEMPFPRLEYNHPVVDGDGRLELVNAPLITGESESDWTPRHTDYGIHTPESATKAATTMNLPLYQVIYAGRILMQKQPDAVSESAA